MSTSFDAEPMLADSGDLDLQELAARLILFVGSTSDLVGITDDHGRVVYLNPAARRALGYVDRPLRGLTLDVLFPSESFERYYEEVRPALLRGETWSGELTMRDASGEPLRVRHTVVGKTNAGGEVEWLATVGRVVPDRARVSAFAATRRRASVVAPDLDITDDDELAHELAVGISQGEIRVQYQPLIEVATGLVAGVEAFARWRHADRGLLDAEEFIDLAERTGLIVPLGLHVMREACHQAGRWARGAGQFAPRVHVNVSTRQLVEPGLLDVLVELLVDVGLAPGQLCFELSPTVLSEDGRAIDALYELHEAGVRLTVDHCTGAADPDVVGEIPVDAVKVAPSLVSRLGTDQGRAEVAQVIDLAHNLGAIAIATGVEMTGQLGTLRVLDCDLAQGLFFARPRRAEGIEMLLGRRFVG